MASQEPQRASEKLDLDGFDALIAEAPDGEPVATLGSPSPAGRALAVQTGFGGRYRPEWARPADDLWRSKFSRASQILADGGIVALIGTRGGGKTQMAAELARDLHRSRSRYATALGLFVRIRSTYNRKDGETESDVIDEFATAPLTILDELQERSDSDWENKILTHVVDRRYSAMRPTVLIANLKPEEIAARLGPSIADRMLQGGGIIQLTGESHRKP